MRTVRWEENFRLPRGVREVLSALRFREPTADLLRTLEDRDWEAALAFCDRAQLTLLVGRLCADSLPVWVRERIGRNLAGHTRHAQRLKGELFEICDRLEQGRIDYLLLKGFSHQEAYGADPAVRVQYDIDLYSPPEALPAALRTLEELGYEPLTQFSQFPLDHLPAMIRRTGWRWRGDFFDPEIPASVDLHFRFWDQKTEGLPAPGLDAFWARRSRQPIDGRPVPVLDPVDALGYASLHLLRHLLRSSARPYHVYELAYFLNAHAEQSLFWETWRTLHGPELRRLEAISFCLATAWFDCQVPPEAQEEIDRLPEATGQWFEQCGAAPMEGLFHPNKEELWLHLPLLDGLGAKARVLRRRLLPGRMPGPVDAVYVPDAEMTWRTRWVARLKYARYAASRFVYHARVLPPTLWRGVSWRLGARGPGPGFWSFLFTAALYNLGVFIFVLLYNLYLLELGYREDFLGLVTGASTAGNLIGALPAAWMAGRLGLKRALILAFVGTGAVSALRSVVSGQGPILGAALAGGLLASIWAVLFAPAVSSLSSERKRPLGFSLFIASGIGMGVVGGLVGGRLPGWFQAGLGFADPVRAKQMALLTGSAIMVLACWPALRLRLATAPPREPRDYRWSPFLVRFLTALAVWSFAVGALNPFYTAYFSRQLHAADAQVGLLFSASQLVQVGAVLLAPLILRRLGVIGGIVSLQLAAAGTLAMLAPGPPLLIAGALFSAFLSFQCMCEPGTYSLLMGGVRPVERNGAAALNFVVLFAAQALAGVAAGAAIARLGYPWVLGASSALALVAAFLFRRLRNGSATEQAGASAQAEESRGGRRNWK